MVKTKLLKNPELLLDTMARIVAPLPPPLIQQLKKLYGHDPFLILVSCLLSLRSRDIVTAQVIKKLWVPVDTPAALLKLPTDELEAIIKPCGFYHRKAQVLQEVSRALLTRFDGAVPSSEEDLLSLPGVGRKTANLVRAEAFGIPAICVDTHVHRIAQHLGLVQTKTVEETEEALKKIFPRNRWAEINPVFVTWGQHICKPGRKTCVCFENLAVSN